MLISFPLVGTDGVLINAEVTVRLIDIYAINQMYRWNHNGGDEVREIVPNCVTINVGRSEFEVQANYDELKTKMLEINEWDKTE